MSVHERDFFDPDIETMPRANIERLQESRILQLIPYVYGQSALVREVWEHAGVTPDDIRSLDDFKAKAPFITKDDMRRFRDRHDDPFCGLTCSGPPHLRGVGFTTGTTGDPTPIAHSDFSIAATAMKRELWQIGVRSNDYFGYMLFTFREGLLLDKFSDAGMIPLTLQHLPQDVPHLVALSRQYRPKALFMLSTPVIMVLDQYQKKTGDDLREAFSSYKGAVFGGEPLNPVFRALVESWGLEIFELSSLGDITTAMECRAHNGLHTWEDLALVEHLDPFGTAPMQNNQRGELVVTSLADDIAPLVRYRTDDLIEYTNEPCTCGRTHGRFKPIGRKGDEMLIGGRSILPIDLFPLMGHFPETHAGLFQLVRAQREADRLTLRVAYDPAVTQGSLDDLARRIEDHISTALRVPVSVQLLTHEEILRNGPPTKIPRVVKP